MPATLTETPARRPGARHLPCTYPIPLPSQLPYTYFPPNRVPAYPIPSYPIPSPLPWTVALAP